MPLKKKNKIPLSSQNVTIYNIVIIIDIKYIYNYIFFTADEEK